MFQRLLLCEWGVLFAYRRKVPAIIDSLYQVWLRHLLWNTAKLILVFADHNKPHHLLVLPANEQKNAIVYQKNVVWSMLLRACACNCFTCFSPCWKFQLKTFVYNIFACQLTHWNRGLLRIISSWYRYMETQAPYLHILVYTGDVRETTCSRATYLVVTQNMVTEHAVSDMNREGTSCNSFYAVVKGDSLSVPKITWVKLVIQSSFPPPLFFFASSLCSFSKVQPWRN
jgi:hypothetical protein